MYVWMIWCARGVRSHVTSHYLFKDRPYRTITITVTFHFFSIFFDFFRKIKNDFDLNLLSYQKIPMKKQKNILGSHNGGYRTHNTNVRWHQPPILQLCILSGHRFQPMKFPPSVSEPCASVTFMKNIRETGMFAFCTTYKGKYDRWREFLWVNNIFRKDVGRLHNVCSCRRPL